MTVPLKSLHIQGNVAVDEEPECESSHDRPDFKHTNADCIVLSMTHSTATTTAPDDCDHVDDAAPPVASLLDKLGNLQKKWNETVVDATPRRREPRPRPASFSLPILSTASRFSVEDSVSPLGHSPHSPTDSPRNYARMEWGSSRNERFGQPNASVRESVFERLYRNDKNSFFHSYATKRRLFTDKSSPLRRKVAPAPPRTRKDMTPKDALCAITSIVTLSSPLPRVATLTKKPLPQPPKDAPVHIPPLSTHVASIFERLHRGEKRDRKLWKDPRRRRKQGNLTQSSQTLWLARTPHDVKRNSPAPIADEMTSTCSIESAGDLDAAALVIQKNYRRYVILSRMGILQLAAAIIQKAWIQSAISKAELRLAAMAVMVPAALTIQRVWRGFSLRFQLNFWAASAAAIAIQAHWRGWAGKRFVIQYRLWKKHERVCAAVLQNFFRGRLFRCQFLRLLNSRNCLACRIQAVVRGAKVRNILRHKSIIVRWWRAICCRLSWLRFRRGLVTAQSRWRGFRIRLAFRSVEQQTITIEATFRGYHAKKIYVSFLRATIHLQSAFRARKSRSDAQRRRKAVESVQSCWRTWQSRRTYTETRKAAVVVQARFRRLGPRRAFMERRLACIVIQSKYRSHIPRQAYLEICSASLQVQQWYRSCLAGKDVRHDACIVIQSTYRFHVLRQAYKDIKAASLQLQQWYRSCLAKKAVKTAACIVIQSVYRAHILRQGYMEVKTTSLQVQNWYRSCLVKKAMRETACIVIQSLFRAHIPRLGYIEVKTASLLMQNWYRSCLTKKAIKEAACIAIQSIYRAHIPRQIYMEVKRASLQVQNWYRSCLANKTRKEDACILVQSRYRSHIPRQAYKEIWCTSIKLQRQFRSYIAQKRCHRFVMSTRIQAVTRGKFARKHVSMLASSASKIQAVARGALLRNQRNSRSIAATRLQNLFRTILGKRNVATVAIQARWRLADSRRKYLARRLLAKHAQSLFRMHRGRSSYLVQKHSALMIQANWRMVVKRNKFYSLRKAARSVLFSFRRKRSRQLNSALVVQRSVRTWICRRNASTLHLCASIIPVRAVQMITHRHSPVWGSRVRRLLIVRCLSAIVLQRWWQMIWLRHRWLKQRRSAQLLQALIKHSFLPRVRTAILLQSKWRMVVARQNYCSLLACASILPQAAKHEMASRIQSGVWASPLKRLLKKRVDTALVLERWWRMTHHRVLYERKKRYVLLLQLVVRRLVPNLRRRRLLAVDIQSRWRRHRCRKKYVIVLSSISMLQALCRGRNARQLFSRHLGALKIQRTFRACYYRRQFKMIRDAALLLQAFSRATLLRRSWLTKKASAVKLQRFWCRAKSIQVYRHCCAATTLQGVARGFLVRTLLWHWGAYATVVQSRWRLYAVKKELCSMHLCALKIQKSLRGFGTRRSLCYQQSAVLTIGRYWRGHSLRLQHSVLQLERSAAVKLQSWQRKLHAMQRFRNTRCAAVAVQHVWRSYTVRSVKAARLSAAMVVQQCYRTYRIHYIETGRFLMACRLQAFARGMHARAFLVANVVASTKVQNWWTTVHCQRAYQKLRQLVFERAAVKLQAWQRKQHAIHKFRNTHSAAIAVQSGWRSYTVRSVNAARLSAAMVVQQYYRTYRIHYIENERVLMACRLQAFARGMHARAMLMANVMAATKVQSWWRTVHCPLAYKKLHKLVCELAAVKLQAWQRMHHAMHRFRNTHCAAVAVQRIWRSYSVRSLNAARSSAALVVQQCYRNHYIHCSERHRFLMACRLQAFARGMHARRLLVTFVKAIVNIQSWWRAIFHQLTFMKLHRQVCKRNGVVRIQSWQRMLHSLHCFQHTRCAAVAVQSVWRSYTVRSVIISRMHAAIIVQKTYRKYHKHCLEREMACRLQGLARGVQARRLLAAHVNAIVKIQCWWIAAQVRQMLQSRVRLQKEAKITGYKSATLIQAHWRCFMMRKCFIVTRVNVSMIQSAWRVALAKKKFCCIRRWSVEFQKLCRGFITRRSLHCEASAAVAIERYWRGYYHRSHGRFLVVKFVSERRAAVKLQAWQRMLRSKHKFTSMRCAAVTLQSVCRSYAVSGVSAARLHAVIMVQRRYRSYRMQCTEQLLVACRLQGLVRDVQAKRLVESQLNAIVSLQSWWRARHNRQTPAVLQASRASQQKEAQLSTVCRAATLLQAHCRCWATRKTFVLVRAYVSMIQSVWRVSLAKKEFKRMQKCAVDIQRVSRGFVVCMALCRQASAAVAMEKYWRGYHERRKHSFIQLQLICERNEAAVKLQAWQRMLHAIHRFRNTQRAAVAVQSIWRSYTVCSVNAARMRAAMVVQQCYRTCHVYRIERERFLMACRLQALARGMHMRRLLVSVKAIVKIQSWWRAIYHGLTFKKLHSLVCERSAAVRIQSWQRMLHVMHSFRSTHRAAVAVQRVGQSYTVHSAVTARMHAAIIVQKTNSKYHTHCIDREQFFMACRLQGLARGMQARRLLVAHLNAIARLQSWWRLHYQHSFRQRQRQSTSPEFRAVVKIQAFMRGALTVKCKNALDSAARRIQAAYRRWKVQVEDMAVQSSSVLLTRSFSGQLKPSAVWFALHQFNRHYRAFAASSVPQQKAVSTCRYYACVVIQRGVRKCIIMRRAATYLEHATIWRYRFLAATVERQDSNRQSVICFQALFRGYRCRVINACHVRKISVFHSCLQVLQARRIFKKKRLAAVVIQRHTRSRLTACILHHRRVVVLQGAFRMHSAVRRYEHARSAAITAQSCFRRLSAIKLRNGTLNAVLKIQRHWRKYLARQQFYRETARNVADVGALRDVQSLLGGDTLLLRESGPCLSRLARRVLLTLHSLHRERELLSEAEHAMRALEGRMRLNGITYDKPAL